MTATERFWCRHGRIAAAILVLAASFVPVALGATRTVDQRAICFGVAPGGPSALSPQDCFSPPPPPGLGAPVLALDGAFWTLGPADIVNSISFGRDPVREYLCGTGAAEMLFSIAPGGVPPLGTAGSAVLAQQALGAGERGGDCYSATLGTVAPNASTNRLVWDENGVPAGSPPSLGLLTLGAGDNIIALEVDDSRLLVDNNGDTGNESDHVYFSLAPGSPSLVAADPCPGCYKPGLDPDGVTPDDILIHPASAAVSPFGIYAGGVVNVGLLPGDVIDSVVVVDGGVHGFMEAGAFPPGFDGCVPTPGSSPDLVLFTLAPGSPTLAGGNFYCSGAAIALPLTGSTVFLSGLDGCVTSSVATAADLGLTAVANVDAMDLVIAPPEPIQFSIAPGGPIPGLLPGGIYGAKAGGGLTPPLRVGPGPLGIVGSDMDSLSFGDDPVDLMYFSTVPLGLFPADGYSLAFSVSPGSVGAAGTAVAAQAGVGEAAGDIFGAPATGINTVLYDENGSIARPLSLLPAAPSSDIDAIELSSQRRIDANDDGFNDSGPAFFSVAAGSPAVGPPAPLGDLRPALTCFGPGPVCGPATTTASDVLLAPAGGGGFGVFGCGTVDMGLMPGDDVDALCVRDQLAPGFLNRGCGPGIDPPGTADFAVFSLAPGSPTLIGLGFSAAQLFITDFDGAFIPYVPPAPLGLALGDDVDGLDCLANFDNDSLPDVNDDDDDNDGVPDSHEFGDRLLVMDGPGGMLLQVDPYTAAPMPIGPLPSPDFDAIAFDSSGTLWGATGCAGAPATALWTIDPNTGAGVPLGPIFTGILGPLEITSMAFSPDGVLYAAGSPCPGGGAALLFAIDTEAVVTSMVSPFGGIGVPGPVSGLAFDNRGALWGVSTPPGASLLLQIDILNVPGGVPGTGAQVAVLPAVVFPGDLRFDAQGILYSSNLFTGELIRIDPVTGGVVVVGPAGPVMTGLAFTPDSDRDGRVDAQDRDADNDGRCDSEESTLDYRGFGLPAADPNRNCVYDIGPFGVAEQTDLNANGWPDLEEYGREMTDFPMLASIRDVDGDEIPNLRDLDSDNDGLSDLAEWTGDFPGWFGPTYGADVDLNTNGRVDLGGFYGFEDGDANGDGHSDSAAGFLLSPDYASWGIDLDLDGIPDDVDTNSDGDTGPDLWESTGDLPGLGGFDLDLNASGTIDLRRFIGPPGEASDFEVDGMADQAVTGPVGPADAGAPPFDFDQDGDSAPNHLDRDADGDGVGDSLDGLGDDDGDLLPNFLDKDNDTDGDGVPNSLDCAPLDPTVWATPGEVTDLALTHSGGVTTLTWVAPLTGGTAASMLYDTLRSTSASNFNSGLTTVCVESDDGPNVTATHAIDPGNKEVYFFQVRPENSCGLGSMGFTSGGSARVGISCP